MENRLAAMQTVLDRLQGTLESQADVIAAIVFGSFITGDTWEHSDIDLFLVVSGEDPDFIKVAIFRSDGIPVHVQSYTKVSFLNRVDGVVGRPLHAALQSGRFLVCRDGEIARRVQDVTLSEYDSNLRSLEETSLAASKLYEAEKHERFRRGNDAAVRYGDAVRHWARARLFRKGIIPSRTPFAQCADQGIMLSHLVPTTIDNLRADIAGLNADIISHLPKMSDALIKLLQNADHPLSIVEIEDYFEDVGLSVEADPLVEWLEESGQIVSGSRRAELAGDAFLEEIVYTCAGEVKTRGIDH